MHAPLVRYQSIMADSARWEQFVFRSGDIVISAPIKCGTTWVQVICGLLIFQQRTFPSTLDLISPWLDSLAAAAGRRAPGCAKAPLVHQIAHAAGRVAFNEHVTYVCVSRDPRDVALSFDSHMSNMNVDRFFAALGRAHLAELAPEGRAVRSGSERERFWVWADAPASPGLRATVHHLTTFWQARERPNVVLLHYDDLKTDLKGQMQRLAARLGLNVPAELWPELVRAATFEEMRRRAGEFVPNATAGVWHDNARFFNKGTSGQWKRLLDDEDLRRYEARITELAAPDLAAWMHRGPIVG